MREVGHAAWLVLALLAAGCRQQMDDQPRYEPLEASRFFPDGQSSRPRVEGTVARGELHADDQRALLDALEPEGRLGRRRAHRGPSVSSACRSAAGTSASVARWLRWSARM